LLVSLPFALPRLRAVAFVMALIAFSFALVGSCTGPSVDVFRQWLYQGDLAGASEVSF